MTAPTPDEAAARCQKCQVYPDGTVYRTRCICPEPLTPEETLRGVSGMGGTIGDAVRDVLAERDSLRARLAAQQPVIDAAAKWVDHMANSWPACTGPALSLVSAVTAYRAALSGSVEAPCRVT